MVSTRGLRHGHCACELQIIPFPHHPYTLSASLAVRLYCRRFAFAFTNDVEMELPAWFTLVKKGEIAFARGC